MPSNDPNGRLKAAIESAVGPGNRVAIGIPAKGSYDRVRVEFTRLDIPAPPAKFKAKWWRKELAAHMRSLSPWITHKDCKGSQYWAYLTIDANAVADILKKSKRKG